MSHKVSVRKKVRLLKSLDRKRASLALCRFCENHDVILFTILERADLFAANGAFYMFMSTVMEVLLLTAVSL